MRRPRATKPLAEKLCAIRLWKNMTQGEILKIVYPEADEDHRAFVSQWENASREPRREVLIRYARLAKITLEELLLDDIELPEHIAINTHRYEGDIRKKREIEAGLVPVSDKDEQAIGNHCSLDKKTMSQVSETISAKSFVDHAAAVPNAQLEEEENLEVGSAAETPDRGASANKKFSCLSLVIGDEQTESMTLELSVETLDELHDLYLLLLSQLPRRLRPSLTVDGIVDFCINVLVDEHNYYKSESIISEHLRMHVNSSEQIDQSRGLKT